MAFEVLDAARQRRLADVQRGRGPHETAVFRQRDHLAQLLEFEGHVVQSYTSDIHNMHWTHGARPGNLAGFARESTAGRARASTDFNSGRVVR